MMIARHIRGRARMRTVRLDRLDTLDRANVYAGLGLSNLLSYLFGLRQLRARKYSPPIPGSDED